MVLERFLGKVVLMTGATQGIGLATARRVAMEGGKVIVSSRREENVKQAVDQLRKEGLEVSGMTCHQGKREDRKKIREFAIEQYGGFDCVFMSAAVSPHIGNLLTVTEEQFKKAFDINVKENFLFIRECLPFLEKRGGGAIVLNGTAGISDYGMAIIGRDIRLYSITKIALSAMTYHIARDCWNRNVRINCILPGTIDTAFLQGGITDELVEKHLSIQGIKATDSAARLGQPSEVAGLVSFLLSEDSSYMTGESVQCAGAQGGNR